MVSPRSQRSRPGVDHIEHSNSTASLFLGGVRRNWMPGSKPSQVASGPQVRDEHTQAMRPSEMNTTAPPPHELDRPAPAEVEGALISPVTPGSILPPSSSLSGPPASVANKPDPPTAALPSPVPSPGSHPSPVITHHRLANGTPTAPSVSDASTVTTQPGNAQFATLPQPPSQPEAVQDHGRNQPTTTTVRSCGQESSESGPRPTPVITNGTQVQSSVTGQASSRSPSVATAVSSSAQESTDSGPQPVQLSTNGAQIQTPSAVTWKEWKAMLEVLDGIAATTPSIIARPRVMLLRDACEYRDLLYLVLHQIYCRRSADGRVLAEFPSLCQDHHQQGLERLEELLERNTRISESMVSHFADFPGRMEDLMHEPWYHVKVSEVGHVLTQLATRFSYIKSHLLDVAYRRRYPPLVEELSQAFALTSPVLITVIFSSTCRFLYGDEKMAILNKLFRQDLRITMKRLDPILRGSVIQAYQKIPIRSPQTAPLPPTPHSASPGAQAQTVPMYVTMPSSTGSQPSVVSPMASVHSNPSSDPGSPHGLVTLNAPSGQPRPAPQMASNSGYPQYQYPSQQTPPVQQVQTVPGSHSHMRRQSAPQGQMHQAHPLQVQSIHQGQAQPGYSAPMYHMVNTGQVHQSPHPHMYSGAPSATSPLVPSQPASPWTRQVLQQQRSQPVNIPLQRHGSGGSLSQSPHSQLGERQTMSPRQQPSSATRGPRPPMAQTPMNMSLVPPPGYRIPQTVHPNPMQLGLHQAGLRDGDKKLVQRGPNGEYIETHLFQYLGCLVLSPQPIDPANSRFIWNLSLSDSQCQRFPRVQERDQGQPPVRTFQPGCLTVRLRSIALSASEKEDLQRIWPTQSTLWPSVVYIFVNGTEMHVRRKAHNGKDLPLDITKHLRAGENSISVYLLLEPKECKDYKYVFGIEIMEINRFEHVRSVAASTWENNTRMDIKKRLTSVANDDDLAVVTDSLTISLVDPFMAQIFTTPVRSEYCDHLECFDLDTFIWTRKNDSGPTPMNDNWRCPICNADARPRCLRVDGFLSEVRQELIDTDRLEGAQAIQVKADGTWTLRHTHDDSPHPSQSPERNRSSVPVLGKRKAGTMVDPKCESPPDSNTGVQTHEPIVIEID